MAATVNWPTPADLTRLCSDIRPLAPRVSIREQIPEKHCKERQHLHRRWRLDVRTLARRVLSGKARAGEGAVLRRLEADLDRDQRHLLRLAEAGKLSQMGQRCARWLRLLREGPAFRHQPPRAGGSRRLHQALLRFRRAGNARPARPRALAVRADEKV